MAACVTVFEFTIGHMEVFSTPRVYAFGEILFTLLGMGIVLLVSFLMRLMEKN